MQSIQAQISDAVIKRNVSNAVRQISDTRYPIKFRYGKNRQKGSWFVVKHQGGKAIWRKVGGYPGLTADKVIKRLPDIMAEMAVNPNSNAVAVGKFVTVADLMNWYIERISSARYLSDKRRAAVASIAKKHVIGKLGTVPICQLDHDQVDSHFIRVLQADYSLAYTRQVYDILRLAFKQAQKLRLIEINPIAAFKFSDFINTSIKAREGKLKAHNLTMLLQQLEQTDYEKLMLVISMLLTGTRIGETLRLRFDWVNWGDKTLHIPAEVTKTRAAHTIPLTDAHIAIIKKYRAIQKHNEYNGVYLFPNHKGSHITDGNASDMIRTVSGGQWTAHDLRKFARTCWMDLGVDYMVGELLLNHKMSKLDQAYLHTHAEQQKRIALEKYHGWLLRNGLKEISDNFLQYAENKCKK